MDDAYRGRVFAFYDMMFNAAFVAGAALSAVSCRPTAVLPCLIALVAAGYAVVAAAYWLAGQLRVSPRRAARRPEIPSSRPAQRSSSLSGPLPAQLARARSAARAGSLQALPTTGPGGTPRIAHDLVAVEVGPEPGQFLLLAELRDALFEAVVGAGQPWPPWRGSCVVQSARVSTCSRVSSGPASRT